MKYIIHYTEMIGRSFVVDADSSGDAMNKVKDLAETGCFELTYHWQATESLFDKT